MEELIYKHILKNPVTGEKEQILIINPEVFAVKIDRLRNNAISLVYTIECDREVLRKFIEYLKERTKMKEVDKRTIENKSIEVVFLFEKFISDNKTDVEDSGKLEEIEDLIENVYENYYEIIDNLATTYEVQACFETWLEDSDIEINERTPIFEWIELFMDFHDYCRENSFEQLVYMLRDSEPPC